jgi:hypothetical protein
VPLQVSRVMSRLSRIGHLSIYYRSTAASHPVCENTPTPYPNASFAVTAEQDIPGRLTSMAGVLTDSDRTGILRWDWDLFPVHNDIWRRAIRLMMRANVQRVGKGQRAFYLDVWNQTLQRPDAHTMTPNPIGVDCLHC